MGLLKLAAEGSNVVPTILRLATVFGLSPRPRFDLVVNRMTAHAVREGVIKILGGDQWRPNIHVSDVSRAILGVLRTPLEKVGGAVLNVGDNSLNMTVQAIGEAVAREVTSVRIDRDPTSVDARNYRVSFDRIRSVLGFEAATSLARGIRELSEFLRANPLDFRDPRFNNS
jgi:nucleoside-diphosphate-sugar epimerase